MPDVPREPRRRSRGPAGAHRPPCSPQPHLARDVKTSHGEMHGQQARRRRHGQPGMKSPCDEPFELARQMRVPPQDRVHGRAVDAAASSRDAVRAPTGPSRRRYSATHPYCWRTKWKTAEVGEDAPEEPGRRGSRGRRRRRTRPRARPGRGRDAGAARRDRGTRGRPWTRRGPRPPRDTVAIQAQGASRPRGAR